MIKVAFIGAGSVEFTRNVVTDLCSYPELNGRLHFALHDISAERLSWADRLTRRIVAQTCWRRTGRCCPRRCCAENPVLSRHTALE